MDGGKQIKIDVWTGDGQVGFEPYGITGEVTQKTDEMFEEGLRLIESVTDSFVKRVQGLEKVPAEFSVEFGIVFKADLGAIIAKTSAEANLKITLIWKDS